MTKLNLNLVHLHKLLNYAYRLYQLSKFRVFLPLMNDYLDQKTIYTLYNRFPTLENFEGQILEKQANFDNSNRVTLVSVQKQYVLVLKLSFNTSKY
jgi:hypothetical protein